MNKKFLYGIIAALFAALALFVGLFVGIKNQNNNSNKSDYVAPEVIDKRYELVDPDLGIVDYDQLEGETYLLKSNNLKTQNAQYFYNNNKLKRFDVTYNQDEIDSLLSMTYAGDVSETFFVTVEELGHKNTKSSLVYIKFSTYLGKFDSEGNLTGIEPAAVVFGYEHTPSNEYTLKYAFCTYSDRGVVTSYFDYYHTALKPSESTLGYTVSMRL